MTVVLRLADDSPAVVERRKIRILDADIHNGRAVDIAEKPGVVRRRTRAGIHVFHFVEHAVELAGKSCSPIADRRMRRGCKVDIALQHIIARKIILHILEFLRCAHKLEAIHRDIAVIRRRCGTACRAADMDITFGTFSFCT